MVSSIILAYLHGGDCVCLYKYGNITGALCVCCDHVADPRHTYREDSETIGFSAKGDVDKMDAQSRIISSVNLPDGLFVWDHKPQDQISRNAWHTTRDKSDQESQAEPEWIYTEEFT